MPGTTSDVFEIEVEPNDSPKAGVSGTKLYKAIGTAAGAAVETAAKKAITGSMGLSGVFREYGQVTAMVLICVGMSMAFMWLRADSKDDRNEYRQQVLRQEQLSEERRREDRQDRQREQDMFRTTLETISRDNRDANMQMSRMTDQVKAASDQIKAASDAMIRVEKAILSKQPNPIP